jgi:hypothetical protein
MERLQAVGHYFRLIDVIMTYISTVLYCLTHFEILSIFLGGQFLFFSKVSDFSCEGIDLSVH